MLQVEFWWLQSYRVAAEYVDCLHTAGQSLLPQALQVALALYSLPLLPGQAWESCLSFTRSLCT